MAVAPAYARSVALHASPWRRVPTALAIAGATSIIVDAAATPPTPR